MYSPKRIHAWKLRDLLDQLSGEEYLVTNSVGNIAIYEEQEDPNGEIWYDYIGFIDFGEGIVEVVER
jgi:hypothetical protein